MELSNLEKIIAKVELVLQRQRQQEQQIEQLLAERTQLRQRLAQASTRVVGLLEQLPDSSAQQSLQLTEVVGHE